MNLAHFLLFDLTTSLGFDLPRAALNALLIVAVGGPILAALRARVDGAALPGVTDSPPMPEARASS